MRLTSVSRTAQLFSTLTEQCYVCSHACVYVSCFMLIGSHLQLITTLLSCFPAGKYSPCTTTEVSNCTVILLLYFIITYRGWNNIMWIYLLVLAVYLE